MENKQKRIILKLAVSLIILFVLYGCLASQSVAYQIQPTLQIGTAEKSETIILQKLLNKQLKLQPGIQANGIFDQKTKDLVIKFQKAKALSPDGKVENKTWQKLFDISVGPNARVSVRGVNVLRGILDEGALRTAKINSGLRTAHDQARIMYGNLELRGVASELRLYGSNGDKVIRVYEANSQLPRHKLIELMRQEIVSIGAHKISKHCSKTHDVIDVSRWSVSSESRFRKSLRIALKRKVISRVIPPPKDLAYHIEIPKPSSIVSGNNFLVSKGQFTFDVEGTEGGPGHSRKPHVPSNSSGVTIGRGYDLKERSKSSIVRDLVAAEIPKKVANQYSLGAGKSGGEARDFISQNTLAEITPRQQKLLFGITYNQIEADVKRICNKADVVSKYGKTNWHQLDSKIRDLVLDLRFRGDYRPSSREFLQKHIAKNDLESFASEITKKSNWPTVPPDRFDRRARHTGHMVLKSGSSGEEVQRLQVQLNRLLEPSPKLSEDGFFGAMTLAAVKAFQAKQSVSNNGIVDTTTWSKLFRPTLRLGSSGEDVKFLQRSLSRVLGPSLGLSVSGNFDSDTKSAVKKFQRTRQISDDGIAGRNTWANLTSAPAYELTTKQAIAEIVSLASKYSKEPGTREWTTTDILKWKAPVTDSQVYIHEFKRQWILGYRHVINAAAKKYQIAPVLLAGVAYNEVGGAPLWEDETVYQTRRNKVGQWILVRVLGKPPEAEKTSFGNVSIQVRRIAETLGFEANSLSDSELRDLINLAKDSSGNIFLVAKHLAQLRKKDFPNAVGQRMSTEEINVVGARYQWGPERTLAFIKQNLDYGKDITKRAGFLKNLLSVEAFDPSELTGSALFIAFPDYPVNTDSFYGYTELVGHAAVVLINDRGLTKFYDFGRYNSAAVGTDGMVRRKPVPNVVMRNGSPTPESMKSLMTFISKMVGKQTAENKDLSIRAAYFRNMSFDRMNAFAKTALAESDPSSQAFNPNRKKYSITGYNCGHFAEAIVLSGNPKVDRPLILIPTPNNTVEEYIEEKNAEIAFDPTKSPPYFNIGVGDESDAKIE